MKIIFLSFILSLFYVGCGGSGSSTETNVEGVEHIFTKKELYSPNLTLLKGSRQYEVNKIDPLTSALSSSYYDFSNESFKDLVSDKQIFVNGKRGSSSDINYELNDNNEIVASFNQEKVYTLSFLSSKKITNQKTQIYRDDINLTGEAYEVSKKYVSDFFVVDDLFSNKTFTNLDEFTQEYRLKPFRGSYLRGLVFFNDNKLQEYNEGNYTDAGTYAIKKIGSQDVLFIYPTNIDHYYAKDSCYILDFARIWKAKCYEKNKEEKEVFYDQDAYDDILDHLKDNFISVNINI